MKSKTKRILAILHIIAWIIFFGLCVKTGAILYSFFVSLFINPVAAKNLHLGLNLSDLFRYNIRHYDTMVSAIIFLSALKAYLFYLVIKVFLKTNYIQPFNTDVSRLISRISYVAFAIGTLTLAANFYTGWLIKQGVGFPDLQEYLGAGGELLFFAGIIFFIAQIFKKGIEIQSENELTV